MNNDKVQHLRNEPMLRFSRFEETYKEYNFEDIAIFSKGKGISKVDIDEEGKLECIRYGELYTKYGEKINTVYSKTNVTEVVLSKRFDVISPSSGETAIDLATASCVPKDGIALGGDINIIRSKENGLYLSYYLNSNKKLDFAKLGQGNSVVHIYNSHLKKLKLKLPSFEEQSKIARSISSIDDKIELMEVKLKNLKLFKKGFVRATLEKHKLLYKKNYLGTHVCSKSKGSNPIYTEKVENLLLTNAYLNDSSKKSYVKNSNDVNTEDVLILWDGSNAGDSYTNTEGVCGSTFVKLELRSNLDNSYLVENIMNDILVIKSIREGSGIPHVPRDFLKYYKLPIPPLKRQTDFVQATSKIDMKISFTNHKLKTLKQFKKGLLQQMFV